MTKTKKIVALLVVVAMLFTFVAAIAACAEPHECGHVCETCHKCTDATCEDKVCADKCEGHGSETTHTCKHVCATCGKCTDAACQDAACAQKCPGHQQQGGSHECKHVCSVCNKCQDTCTDSACAQKCETTCPGNPDYDDGKGGADEKGTEANPFTIAEAIAKCTELGLADKAYSTDYYWVKGIVKGEVAVNNASKGAYGFDMVDEEGDTTIIKTYYMYLAEGVDLPAAHDTVLVYGKIQNYYGTVEITAASSDEVQSEVKQIVEVGISTITAVENDYATINLSKTQGENRTSFTFTVTVTDEGYELVSAKVNGVKVEDTDGTYTGTINGDTKVSVELKQKGAADPVLVATLDLKASDLQFTTSSTVNTYTGNGITVTNEKGSASSWYTPSAGQAQRFYASTNITFAYTSAFKYVVLTCESGKATLGSTTGAGLTITEESTTRQITITLDSAADSFTLTKIAVQVRIEKVEVYA
ncbi:MAG: hypothetical protein J1F65_05315 [Clostridiales bacterium]|nr:hypothetical protein [Clostridiales bacterium]